MNSIYIRWNVDRPVVVMIKRVKVLFGGGNNMSIVPISAEVGIQKVARKVW